LPNENAKRPIRILHVVDDLSHRNTGVTSVVRQLSAWAAARCDWVGIYTPIGPEGPLPEDVHVFVDAPHPLARSLPYPVGHDKVLEGIVDTQGISVIHLHGLWSAPSFSGQRVARRAGIATLLTVHGQTEPWALHSQGTLKYLKKQLFWHGFLKFVLRRVTELHAITHMEQAHMSRFFSRSVSQVIPNAVDEGLTAGLAESGNAPPSRRMLFLGRLHPKKGVDLLVRAFGQAELAPDWRLAIAGPDSTPGYTAHLKELAAASGRAQSIDFLGPVLGPEKMQLLRDSWVVLVPSHSEVVGMVNLEAGIVGTPSITTFETGLSDWEEGGGILVHPRVDELRQSIERVARWSEEDRASRGLASEQLVRTRYTLSATGRRWMALYSQLHGTTLSRPRATGVEQGMI